MTKKTTVFDVFEKCVKAVLAGELIESVSAKDKEFHFQNWFQKRLQCLSIHFEASGRNTYPDFCLVEHAEGYEIKDELDTIWELVGPGQCYSENG